jgi:hypothetical protein
MNAKIIVVLLTLFLVAFFVMMATGISDLWKNTLIMISPIVFISAVILVLRDRSFDYPELKEDEEFGYVDRPDLRH